MLQPSPLNEKVLREKRKKLKETFDRVMRLYVSSIRGRRNVTFYHFNTFIPLFMQHNDDPELWSDLKRKEIEYEKRRNKRIQYYESVRHAQTVQIEDIPLPQMSEQPPSTTAAIAPPTTARPPLSIGPNIELPSGMLPLIPVPGIPPPSLQKRLPERTPTAPEEKRKDGEPPGCPPGPPPDLHSMHELDSDYEDEENIRPVLRTSVSNAKPLRNADDDRGNDDKLSDVDVPKPTSVQQRILAIAGQKYDDFMKELENVHKNKEKGMPSTKQDSAKRAASDNDDDDADDDHMSGGNRSDSSRDKQSDGSDGDDEPPTSKPDEPMKAAMHEHRTITLPRPPPAPPMPPMMKLPSGPPPAPMGMPPAMMFRPPPMRPGLSALGMRMPPGMPRIRMPPGPPPGMPPQRMMHGHPHHKMGPNPIHNAMAAGSQMAKDSTKGMTTITAKPQIRNLSADVTRFVPSTLRVKREDKKVQRPKPYVSDYRAQPEQPAKGTTKDDAYMQFMREMQGLL